MSNFKKFPSGFEFFSNLLLKNIGFEIFSSSIFFVIASLIDFEKLTDYYYDDSEEKYAHKRNVEWKKIGEWNVVENDSNKLIIKTLLNVNNFKGYAEELMNIMGVNNTNNTASDESRNYYWVNARPSYWTFDSIPVGGTIEFSSVNDNGNKRRIYQYYVDAKAGDKFVGYESTPKKEIVCIGEVVEKKSNNNLILKKTKNLINTIGYNEILSYPELKNMEYIFNFGRSLSSIDISSLDTSQVESFFFSLYRLIIHPSPNSLRNKLFLSLLKYIRFNQIINHPAAFILPKKFSVGELSKQFPFLDID